MALGPEGRFLEIHSVPFIITNPPPPMLTFPEAVIVGLVRGIAEWLPVSAREWFPLSS
jgi:hypothetical protein